MPRLHRSLYAAVLLVALIAPPVIAKEVAAPAAATALAPNTIGAVATVRVAVERPEDPSQATIAAAVRSARRHLPAVALRAVRLRAVELGVAARVRVGALVALSDQASGPPYFFDEADGTFGPGRYCGRTRQPIFRMVNGQRRRTGRFRTRFSCRVPRFATRTVQATYAIDGPVARG